MAPDPDVQALVDEMDAERARPGQRCYLCHRATPTAREFIRLARSRGHSYQSISRKLLQAFDFRAGHGSLQNHLDNHDGR